VSTLIAAPTRLPAPAGEIRRGVIRRRRRRVETLLLLLPGAGFIAVAMVAPLLQLAFGSVGLAGLGSERRFSLAAFQAVPPSRRCSAIR
jgi:hypothetical protein